MHDHRSLALGSFALVLAAALPAQLGGTYRVNPAQPASSASFPSLAAAVAALTTQGVNGPVEFLLYDDAGPYTELALFATGNPLGANTAVLALANWNGASAINRVTFRAAPGERVVLEATGRAVGVFWGGADFVTLRDVEIRNAIHDGVSLYAEGAQGIANDAILDGCRIHDCGGTAVTIYGNSSPPTNTVVRNCTIWSCQQQNAGAFATTGRFAYVTTRNSVGTRVVHNTFFVDTGSGASFAVFGANTLTAAEAPYAEISNNIVVRTATAPGPIFRIRTLNGAAFPVPAICDSNCFFDTTGNDFARFGMNAATVAPTLPSWQQNGVDLLSLLADPQLQNPGAHDFHVLPTSPCLGASMLASGVAFDVDGQPRTTALEIGADEFSAAHATIVGNGCSGVGAPPALTTYTWPFLGNAGFALTFEQLPPNWFAVLFGSLALAPAPIPLGGGCSSYLDFGTLTALAAATSGPAGTASVVLAVPANAAFIGFEIGYQGVVPDAAAPLGLAVTNGLDVVFDF